MVESLTRDYELVMVLDPDLEESVVEDTLARIRKIISDSGGSIVAEDRQGLRKIAYPINKKRQGNYIISQLALMPESAVELSSNLNLSEAVLRHMIVRKSQLKPRTNMKPPSET